MCVQGAGHRAKATRIRGPSSRALQHQRKRAQRGRGRRATSSFRRRTEDGARRSLFPSGAATAQSGAHPLHLGHKARCSVYRCSSVQRIYYKQLCQFQSCLVRSRKRALFLATTEGAEVPCSPFQCMQAPCQWLCSGDQ